MTGHPGQEIVRSTIFHTPRSPFTEANALEVWADGALLIEGGRLRAAGDFAAVRRGCPAAPVRDLRGGLLLPGLVDTHVHFPQLRIIGGLGCTLLDWLHRYALPEEVRMGGAAYARAVAAEFVRALAAHGTTTALVFGSHFPGAMDSLFQAASGAGLRVLSGLVLSDRNLPDALLQTPDAAHRESTALIKRHHGRGGMRYVVTPRFALSASEAMLEVCQTLLREHPELGFQTHLNEHPQEVAEVLAAFPWAGDYLATYERYGLAGPRSVFAHNVHASDGELARLAASGAAVAHCPCSNAALGSGIFPMRRHLAAGVRFALGTDVGAGTGFGILKEALQSYLVQRQLPDGVPLTAAHLLYLATRAGALALGLGDETGDFALGKSADYVHIAPPSGSPLEAALAHADSPERMLAAAITMAGAESVREVRVRGRAVAA